MCMTSVMLPSTDHFPPKIPIIIGSFAKMACNLIHPVGLRHPVTGILHPFCSETDFVAGSKLHRCHRLVDCFLIDRSICHGRYRRSMPIHLLVLENTVDIASTVDRSKSTLDVDLYQKKSIDRIFPKSRKKGPLTYVPISVEKWFQTHIYQEVMVPYVVRNGPNAYPNIDTYPPIYRPGRSVTVDIDGQCRFTNRRIRSTSTVDAYSPTENYGRSSIVD